MRNPILGQQQNRVAQQRGVQQRLLNAEQRQRVAQDILTDEEEEQLRQQEAMQESQAYYGGSQYGQPAIFPNEQQAQEQIEEFINTNPNDLTRQGQFIQADIKRQHEEEQERLAAEQRAIDKRKNANFFVRLGHTLGDFFGNLGAGLLRGLEGIMDFVINMVTFPVTVFSQDAQDAVTGFIAQDLVGDNITRPMNEALEHSWMADGGVAEGIASGIGQMLPKIALVSGIAIASVPTGGAAAKVAVAGKAATASAKAAKAGKAAAKTTKTAAQKAAQKQAYTAAKKKANKYGTAMFMAGAAGKGFESAYAEDAGFYQGLIYGLASGGVEGLIEMASGGLAGTQAGTVFGQQVARGTVGRIASAAIGEGLEEVAMDLIDPLLRRATGVSDEIEMPGITDLAQTFAVGAGVGGVMGGATGQFSNRNSVADSASEISAINRREANMFNSAKGITQEQVDKISRQRQTEISNIETRLKKMSATKRETTIKEFGLENRFDNDGNYIAASGENASFSPNVAAISPRLKEAVQRGTTTLDFQPTQNSVSSYATQVKGYITSMSTNAQVVITDSFIGNAGYSKNNGVFYINNNITQEGLEQAKQTAEGIAIEELKHDIYNRNTLSGDFLDEFALEGMTEAQKNEAIQIQKDLHAEHIDPQTGRPIEISDDHAFDEVVAQRLAEKDLLGNVESINRIASENKGVAARMYYKLRDIGKRISNIGNKQEQARYARVRKAEQLYANAIREAHGDDFLRQLRKITNQEEWDKFEQKIAELDEINRSGEQGATQDGDVRYSLRNIDRGVVETRAREHYGSTRNWAETAFLNTDGTQLDFSEQNDGGRRGQRSLDHRDIANVYIELGETFSKSQGEALVDFMARGNIRIIPESDGINLSVMPTEAQFDRLRDFIDRANGEVMLEIDNTGGYTIHSIEYPVGTRDSRVINDIRAYFDSGKVPQVSDVSRFRYSLRSDGNTQGSTAYSYDTLTSKPDMQITPLTAEAANDGSQTLDRQALIAQGMENSRAQNNPNNTETATYVRVGDIGLDVLVTNAGLRHGLDRISKASVVMPQVGDVLSNAVAINELDGRQTGNRQTDMSYVLLGYAHDSNNDYAVRFVIDKVTNNVTDLEIYQTKSIRALKKAGRISPPAQDSSSVDLSPLSPATISIRNLLEHVKDISTINEVLSQDVLSELGVDRSQGTLSSSIRYSLPPKGGYKRTPSRGQFNKWIADHSKVKSYSRADAQNIINTIIAETVNESTSEHLMASLVGKNKQQAIEAMWVALNANKEGYRMGSALEIADFIIQNTVMEDVFADDGNSDARWVVETIGAYRGSVDLDSIRGDVMSRFDKNNTIFAQWGKRKGQTGISPDQIAPLLEESGIYLEGNPINSADIFFRMYDMYTSARNSLQKQAAQRLSDIATKTEQEQLRQSIATEILRAYDSDSLGQKTQFQKQVERYTRQISALRTALKEAKSRNTATNNLLSTVQRVKKITEYKPAGVQLDPRVERFVKAISKLETWRGNLNKTARENLKRISDAYKAIFAEEGMQNPFMEQAAEIAGGDGQLTTLEIQSIDNILKNFIHEVQNSNKVLWEGKRQDVDTLVKSGITQAKKNRKLNKVEQILRSMSNPAQVFSRLDNYKNGLFTQIFNQLQEAVNTQAAFEMEYYFMLDEFRKKYPKYTASLHTLQENGLTKGQALQLYMTWERQQGRLYLEAEEAHIKLSDAVADRKGQLNKASTKGTKRLFDESIVPKKADLSTEDLAYLELVRKLYDFTGDKISEVERARYGVETIKEPNYTPIARDGNDIYSILGEARTAGWSLARPSFTYALRTPAKGATLFIGNIANVLDQHLKRASTFYAFAVPVNEIARVYNHKAENTSLKEQAERQDDGFGTYFNKLLQDIQGIRTTDMGMLEFAAGKLRTWHARAMLGLNPRVWFNEMTSLPMAKAAGLKYRHQAAAFARVWGKTFTKQNQELFDEMVRENPFMFKRYQESIGIKEAMGIKGQSRFDRIMDKTMTPIQLVDRKNMMTLWLACKNQHGGDLTKAKKMFMDVVGRTQNSYSPINRSGLMRSKSEITRSLTMFMTQPLQNLSMLYHSMNKYVIAKRTNDTDMQKAALNEIGATYGAFAIKTGLFLAIAQAFRFITGRERRDREGEEISIGEDILRDLGGTLFNMFPVARDAYQGLVNGFDANNVSLASFNTMISSVSSLWNAASAWWDSDTPPNATRTRGQIRNFTMGLTQATGVPLRNIERYTIGIIGNVSPTTRAEYEAAFRTQPNAFYFERISEAMSNNDTSSANRYLNIMFNERTGRMRDDRVLSEMNRLIGEGHTSILPRSLGNSVTHEGESVDLNRRQHQRFSAIYHGANDTVKRMINSSAFDGLDDAARAAAIRRVYDFYFNLGLQDFLGVDIENRTLLMGQGVPIEYLAMVAAQANLLTADVDRQGNPIQGSRKIKIQALVQSLPLNAAQKYMVMGFLGYRNQRGGSKVRAHINRLPLSRPQQDALFHMSGFTGNRRGVA